MFLFKDIYVIDLEYTVIFTVKQDSHSDSELKARFKLKGKSKNEEKAGHFVPKYLIEHGYNVIPVNPTITEVLGIRSYSKVADIPEKIDIVNIFRRSHDVPAVIDDALNRKESQSNLDAIRHIQRKCGA